MRVVNVNTTYSKERSLERWPKGEKQHCSTMVTLHWQDLPLPWKRRRLHYFLNFLDASVVEKLAPKARGSTSYPCQIICHHMTADFDWEQRCIFSLFVFQFWNLQDTGLCVCRHIAGTITANCSPMSSSEYLTWHDIYVYMCMFPCLYERKSVSIRLTSSAV